MKETSELRLAQKLKPTTEKFLYPLPNSVIASKASVELMCVHISYEGEDQDLLPGVLLYFS